MTDGARAAFGRSGLCLSNGPPGNALWAVVQNPLHMGYDRELWSTARDEHAFVQRPVANDARLPGDPRRSPLREIPSLTSRSEAPLVGAQHLGGINADRARNRQDRGENRGG